MSHGSTGSGHRGRMRRIQDYTSGLAGNVVVGRLYDRLVDLGGTAIFEEIVEAIGLDHLLIQRAVDERAREELRYTYDKALDYCKSVQQYSVSLQFCRWIIYHRRKEYGSFDQERYQTDQGCPESIWICEKAVCGCLIPPGSRTLCSLGLPIQMITSKFMDLISCGAHIVLLVTGRGNVVGSAVGPCIKITGNHSTFQRMRDDMDFDASPILSGEMSQEEI